MKKLSLLLVTVSLISTLGCSKQSAPSHKSAGTSRSLRAEEAAIEDHARQAKQEIDKIAAEAENKLEKSHEIATKQVHKPTKSVRELAAEVAEDAKDDAEDRPEDLHDDAELQAERYLRLQEARRRARLAEEVSADDVPR